MGQNKRLGDIDQAKKEILEGVDNYNKAKVKPAF
jgi:hypothetical protein